MVLNLPFGGIPTGNLYQDPDVRRTATFITNLRRRMLINGNALGGRFWRVRGFRDGHHWPQPRVVVECDDSWDEDTSTHLHHDEDTEYDPR